MQVIDHALICFVMAYWHRAVHTECVYFSCLTWTEGNASAPLALWRAEYPSSVSFPLPCGPLVYSSLFPVFPLLPCRAVVPRS